MLPMKRIILILVLTLSTLLLATSCSGLDVEPGTETETNAEEDTTTSEELTLSSTAFVEGEDIPTRHTCDGENVSPQLAWNNAPAGTQSFALIMDDPDAPGGIFTHWVIFDLPADVRHLPEAVPAGEELDNGARHGLNSFGEISYGGPCPPSGPGHRYQFTLYALDTTLNLPAGASKQQVLDAMQGHILASVTLTGLYQR
jgi:Raf kinase inhibitor-like YbhB/YbcL family protein